MTSLGPTRAGTAPMVASPQAPMPSDTPTLPDTPTPQRWRDRQSRSRRPVLSAMLCIAAVAGLQPLDPSLHSIAFPGAVADLGMNPGTASFVRSIGTIVLAAAMLGVGILGDRFGRRRTLVSGVALMAIAAVVSAVAPTTAVFTAGRIAMGIGTAMSFSMCLAMIPTLFARAALPKAFGILFSIGSAMLVVFTGGSGALLAAFGWRTMYALLAVLAAVAAVAALVLLPENRSATRRRFDGVGVALAGAGLIAMVYSIGRASVFGWTHPVVVTGLLLAAAVLGVFAWWELRRTDPGFPIRLFAIPAFSAACIAGVLFNWADASLLGQYPAFALPGGVPPAAVTVVVALMYLGMMSGAMAAGASQRRFMISNRGMFVSGLMLCAASLASQFFVTSAANIWLPAIGLFTVGFAVMWMQNPQAAVILGSAPPDQVGAVGAVKPAVGQLGFGLGFAIAGPIASLFASGPVLDAHAYGHGLATQSIVFVLAAFLVGYLLRPRRVATVERAA